MRFKHPHGATPLEDISGLIPKHVSTQEELNELEFANNNQAVPKYFLGKLSEKKAPFHLTWLLQVHDEMFGEVWQWAGKLRKREYNIGALPAHMSTQLKQLLDDFAYWESAATMPVSEIAARLHHGLVKVHPFNNGNGRWSRFIANIYLRKKASPLIRWPEKTLQEKSPLRKEYIDALQEADRGNFQKLIALHHKFSSPTFS